MCSVKERMLLWRCLWSRCGSLPQTNRAMLHCNISFFSFMVYLIVTIHCSLPITFFLLKNNSFLCRTSLNIFYCVFFFNCTLSYSIHLVILDNSISLRFNPNFLDSNLFIFYFRNIWPDCIFIALWVNPLLWINQL